MPLHCVVRLWRETALQLHLRWRVTLMKLSRTSQLQRLHIRLHEASFCLCAETCGHMAPRGDGALAGLDRPADLRAKLCAGQWEGAF